ncbi:MAG: DUF4412 domain-containing protein [bacterium]|nr:DUF4412 domain-containing protein [bacterium]
MVRRIYITAFTLLLGLSAISQTILSEGKIFYDISYLNLPEEMKRNEHLMPHDASFYFKNNKTRFEMGIGGLGKNTTIYDRSLKQNTILLNIKGKKFAMIKSDSEMVAAQKSLISNDTNNKFLRLEILDQHKKIAERNCQKAIVYRMLNGKEQANECWFTKEIPPFNTINDPNLKALDGFLMQYTISENGMSMNMTVKMVMPIPIEDAKFEIPLGYQVVTEKELYKLLLVLQFEDEK